MSSFPCDFLNGPTAVPDERCFHGSTLMQPREWSIYQSSLLVHSDQSSMYDCDWKKKLYSFFIPTSYFSFFSPVLQIQVVLPTGAEWRQRQDGVYNFTVAIAKEIITSASRSGEISVTQESTLDDQAHITDANLLLKL